MGAWEPGRKRTEQHDILLIRPFKFMLLAELHLHTEVTQPHLYTPRWCCTASQEVGEKHCSVNASKIFSFLCRLWKQTGPENTVDSYTKFLLFFLFTKQLNDLFFLFFFFFYIMAK